MKKFIYIVLGFIFLQSIVWATNFTLLDVDNIRLDASTISTITAGDLTINPAGTGDIYFHGSTALIDSSLNLTNLAGIKAVSGLTASTALVTNSSKDIASSAVTATELGYLSGVSSALQTQIDGKANITLSNLGTVAANASINPGTDGVLDLGDNTHRWDDLYANNIFDVNNGTGSSGEVLTALGDGTFDWKPGTGAGLPTIITNGDFELGSSNWTASGGSYATTTSSPMIGTTHATWDSNAASQTLSNDSVTIPPGYYATNGEAFCYIKTPSGSSTHKLQVYDGTNVLAEQSVISTTASAKVGVNFVFPSSGSLVLRLISVASDEPSISIDGCYMGPSFNVGSVAQANFLGSVTTPYTASCTWTTTSTTFASFSADSDCPTATVEGSVSAPATKIPGLIIPNAGPGTYYFVAVGAFWKTAAGEAYFRFSDGTNASAPQFLYDSTAANNGTPMISGYLTRTTATTNWAIDIQAAKNNATNVNIDPGINNNKGGLQIQVYYFPSQNQTVYTTDQSDYGWTEYTPASTQGFGTVTNGKFWSKRVGDSIFLQASWTNGTVTASEARISLPTGLTIDSTKVTAQRKVGDFTSNTTGNTYAIHAIAVGGNSYINVGRSLNSTNPATLVNGNDIFNNTTGVYMTAGPIPITGWANTNRAPQLVNSVLNTSSGVTRIETAKLNCDSSSSITSQHGSWISSIGNISSGFCTVTITTGTFSSTPFCMASWNGSGGEIVYSNATSATSTTFGAVNDAGSAVSSVDGFLMCMGAK